MSVNILDEEDEVDGARDQRVSRMLTRSFFEQFPMQNAPWYEMARSLLLFGELATLPEELSVRVMNDGWFERITNGLSLYDYVNSVAVLHLLSVAGDGEIHLDYLDERSVWELLGEPSKNDVLRVLESHMGTTVDEFKIANCQHQDGKPDAQKKYAFNHLAARPFVTGVASVPIAPSLGNVLAKSFPPAIYHMGVGKYGDAFANDLGGIFEIYTGRQLRQIEGAACAIREVSYRLGKDRLDSCDWILDLPGLQVLIECKIRQPNESLRTRDMGWLQPIEGTINRAIQQLNRSDRDIAKIAEACSAVDAAKPRVGLVVTLESFFVGHNWHIWDHLEPSSFPVGVISIGELESLVPLGAEGLAQSLLEAIEKSNADVGRTGLLLLHDPLVAARGIKNPLLEAALSSSKTLSGSDPGMGPLGG